MYKSIRYTVYESKTYENWRCMPSFHSFGSGSPFIMAVPAPAWIPISKMKKLFTVQFKTNHKHFKLYSKV